MTAPRYPLPSRHTLFAARAPARPADAHAALTDTRVRRGRGLALLSAGAVEGSVVSFREPAKAAAEGVREARCGPSRGGAGRPGRPLGRALVPVARPGAVRAAGLASVRGFRGT
ncbi:hypothetical protein SSPO_038050 [Streptomyces antimycoticus]|uniref:Uncharacterized protein n=1 Tax=Streptomyces antimycoticus TaxID=68175 RepID=A0A499V4L9_9ACTN|nr:hypothetical protein SSPO_038050 [Streptomyces antimycoticus]